MCAGCNAYFCLKHFGEHVQQLSVEFDNDIVRPHDDLLDQINKLEELNNSSANIFLQINQWEKETIDKVKKAAEKARRELTELLNEKKVTLSKDIDQLTTEIRSRHEEQDFVETDIERLREKIDKIQLSLHQLTLPNSMNVTIMDNDKIDWNSIICIEKEGEYTKTHFI
ncbi:unnamed protein product [Rotaria sp. Silwood1]|nr:unnamed protein product [Rotaria sp. Silwood1]